MYFAWCFSWQRGNDSIWKQLKSSSRISVYSRGKNNPPYDCAAVRFVTIRRREHVQDSLSAPSTGDRFPYYQLLIIHRPSFGFTHWNKNPPWIQWSSSSSAAFNQRFQPLGAVSQPTWPFLFPKCLQFWLCTVPADERSVLRCAHSAWKGRYGPFCKVQKDLSAIEASIIARRDHLTLWAYFSQDKWASTARDSERLCPPTNG